MNYRAAIGWTIIGLLIWTVIALAAMTLIGCTAIHDFHNESKLIATCDVTQANQIEAMGVRTGFPLLSTPHRYSCYMNDEGKYVYIVENSSESSLETLSDLPTAAIQRITPTAPLW